MAAVVENVNKDELKSFSLVTFDCVNGSTRDKLIWEDQVKTSLGMPHFVKSGGLDSCNFRLGTSVKNLTWTFTVLWSINCYF